jgi:hypothetical protein
MAIQPNPFAGAVLELFFYNIFNLSLQRFAMFFRIIFSGL